MDDFNDNKKFWKIVKPIFTNKGSKSSKIILVENEEILSDTAKISEIMNDYFVNVTKDLDISIPSPILWNTILHLGTLLIKFYFDIGITPVY